MSSEDDVRTLENALQVCSDFKNQQEALAALDRIRFIIINLRYVVSECNHLRERDAILTALENAGISSWSGYSAVVRNVQ